MFTILVIDNDETMRLLYSDVLGEEGYDVVTAGWMPGLIGLIEKIGPDLIVLDEELSRKRRMQIVRYIRGRDDSPPVLLSSNFPPPSDAEWPGVDDYVLKSSHMGGLKNKIRERLSGSAGAVPGEVSRLPGASGICTLKGREPYGSQLQDFYPEA